MRPTVSTMRPVTSDGNHIAPTCSPMTRPTAPMPWPWAAMWTGVMVMIATMMIWVRIMTVAPSQAPAPTGGMAAVPWCGTASSVLVLSAGVTVSDSCRANR